MAGLVRHRRALTGVSGYIASRRLPLSLQELLLGTHAPVEFHASSGDSLAVTFPLSRGVQAHSATFTRSTKTCTKRLRVLLSDDVEGVGKSGEVVLVASGYARNYLVPNRLARIHVEEDRASRTRYRGLSFAAMKHAQRVDEAQALPVAASTAPTASSAATAGAASLAKEEMLIEHKKELKKQESIVRKLTENPVVFKGTKSTNGVLEATIGPSEIRLATAKQLGIEIVDELIDMEGDVLDRPGDYLIPLKLEDTRSSSRPKLNVRILD